MGRKQETAEVQRDRQHVARVLDRHLAAPRIDRRTVTLFTKEHAARSQWLVRRQARQFLHQPTETALSAEDQGRLTAIKQELTKKDIARRESKESKYSIGERTRLLLRAKVRSGLDKEQQHAMYSEAGFTEREIKGITKGGGAVTVFTDSLLTSASYAAAGTAIIKDNLLSVIPDTTSAALGTVLAYLVSFGVITWQNLRLTKEFGASGNVWLTGSYALGNKLLPDKIRDIVALGTPALADLITKGGALGVVLGATGDLHKAAAASAIGAAFNGVLAGGSEILLRLKKRKNAKTQTKK